MKIHKDEQLRTLKELALQESISFNFLVKQAKLGRLNFEKKGRVLYSTQKWINEYKVNFTFDGFMLDRVFKETANVYNKPQEKKLVSAPNNVKKKTGKIIKEEKVDIDIEEMFVSKWNKEFKKINNEFIEYLDTSKNSIERPGLNIKTNEHKNIHAAVLIFLMMFFMSFFLVSSFPGPLKAFTKSIDKIIDTPYKQLNKVAANIFLNTKNKENQNTEINSSHLSGYVKNSASNISYPAGSSVAVNENQILGRVAGIEEKFSDEKTAIEKFKDSTLSAFGKMAEKQKRASLEFNKKLEGLISSILK